MKQLRIYLIIILAAVLVAPSVALAAWWNPLTWFNNWGMEAVTTVQNILYVNKGLEATVSPTDSSTAVNPIDSTATPSTDSASPLPVGAINAPETTSLTITASPSAYNTYGVKMDDKCATVFQNFINAYGQDYSKCLADFDFDKEEYCGGFNPETQGLSNINVLVILDASGSMAEEIGSQKKIDVAKKAVSDFLTKMPQGVNTGLIVYGDKGSNSLADKDVSCKGLDEVINLGPNNSNNIISAISSFQPKGWTPIAGSIDFAKDIFEKTGTETSDKDYLILVSDGVESCGGDPSSAAEDLQQAIPGSKLDIMGFTDDNAIQQSLQSIATLGGGSYLTVSNSSDITDAFNGQLLLIKEDCISVTQFKLSLDYSENNLNNLNCWLAAQKEESDSFAASVSAGSNNTECNTEMYNALEARQNNFWYQKEDLKEKGDVIYKQKEAGLSSQLDDLSK